VSNSFKLCPIHFSRGGEIFSRGVSPCLGAENDVSIVKSGRWNKKFEKLFEIKPGDNCNEAT